MNAQHLQLLNQLLDTASVLNLPIWIGGGWAIDARLGRVTREHDDIDLTFPTDRKVEFVASIKQLGGHITEETSYGFLVLADGILLDCEPAHWTGRSYEVEGAPTGACPDEFEGELDGRLVRCSSWEAIAWDYFYYAREIPPSAWPAKHQLSFRILTESIGEAAIEQLRSKFLTQYP